MSDGPSTNRTRAPVPFCAVLRSSAAWLWLIVLVACTPTSTKAPVAVRGQSQAARAELVQPPFLGVEQCYNAWDDNDNGLMDEGCSVPQAAVLVMLAWSNQDADLDLVVADPQGEVATPQAPTKSGLATLVDCPEDDECGAQPYEIALVEDDTYVGGHYRVQVLARHFAREALPMVAQLGIVTPEGTSAYRLEFFDLGQTVSMDFVVAEPTQIE